MIKLDKVSKIYYQNGVIATGFNNVSLEFKMGEFVAIVGESGSGKSTLLNVISGLDTYEEGEMYINGEETSHYSEEDFEEYRRKYVANIFQAFNLVNSYTVKQNIELVLLLHGYNRRVIKSRVNDILNKVGLYKIRNKKASRLSGGQKQRVAIARALAKDTPIIVADEPTGNLDQKSAKDIMNLLSEISKDKLVVMVTHNFEQVEDLVTRVIKMHDGKVIEDKKVKKVTEVEAVESMHYKMKFSAKIKLGLRNTFNVFFKFALSLIVFLVLAGTFIDKYTGTRRSDINDILGQIDTSFRDKNPKRIIVKKTDNSQMNESDYEFFKTLKNVDSINELDTSDVFIQFMSEDYSGGEGIIKPMSEFNLEITEGEVVDDNDIIYVHNGDFLNKLSLLETNLFDSEVSPVVGSWWSVLRDYKYHVSAIAVDKKLSTFDYYMYVKDDKVEELNRLYYVGKTKFKLTINNKNNLNSDDITIIYSTKLNPGEIYLSKDMNSYCKNDKCNTTPFKLTGKTSYFELSKDLTFKGLLTDKTIKKYCDDCYAAGVAIVNIDDAKELSFSGYYQSSVYVSDLDFIDGVKKELEDAGYKVLALKDTLPEQSDLQKLTNLISYTSLALQIFIMTLISSVILNAILKSKNRYYAVVRILGGNLRICRQLINIELFTIATIAYSLIMGVYYGLYVGGVSSYLISNPFEYLRVDHFIFIYLVIIILSQYLARKFAKSIFKDSMITTYNMEV